MAKKLTRRHLLGLTVAAVGGVTAVATGASPGTTADSQPDRPSADSPRTYHDRPYWEASYSGGPVDVKPLPPGRPGKDYTARRGPDGLHAPVEDRGWGESLSSDRRGGGPRL